VIAAELLPSWLAYTAAFGNAVLVHALAYGELWGAVPHVSISLQGEALMASPHKDVFFVAEVTAALSAMMFMIVFIGSSIAGRLRDREAQLEDACRRLGEIDEVKGFFMRKAGHEMRGPLAAIVSILDAVSVSAADLDESSKQRVQQARRRISAMMDLVHDLRRYAWLRSPAATGDLRQVDLHELLDAAVEQIAPKAELRGISVTCAAAEPIKVIGDEEMLRDLLGNLLANAVQYTLPGGHVEIELTSQAGMATLTVADTGIGISPEAEARMFEEFYRSEEARGHLPDGTGLGLAIARRISELHHGRISARGRRGGGAVFSVSIPLWAAR